MGTDNPYKQMDRYRRRVKKLLRDWAYATTHYRCQTCSMMVMFEIGRGVGPLEDEIPLPPSITCPACDESMERGRCDIVELECERPFNPDAFRLRVPSRRAAARLAREGLVQAQVVYPEDNPWLSSTA